MLEYISKTVIHIF